MISGVAASLAERADPVCLTPAESSWSSVCRITGSPWSRVWFDAVEQVS
jgi:hypothetical protein